MGTIQVFACENIFVSPENVWSEIVDSNRWQWNPAIFYIKPITPMGSNNEGELTLNNEVEIGFRDATAPRYVRAKITRLVPYEQIVFVWSEVANIIQGGALHMAIEVVGVSQVKFTTVLYYSGLWSWMTQTDFEETQTRDLEAMCTALKTRLESRYKRDTKSTYENANGVVLGLSPPRWRRNGARCQQCKCTLAQIALMAIGSGLMARHHCRHCGGAFCGDCCKKTHTVPSWYDLSEQRVCDMCYKDLAFASAPLSDEARAEIARQHEEVAKQMKQEAECAGWSGVALHNDDDDDRVDAIKQELIASIVKRK